MRTPDPAVLALVHQGWHHLKLQRPLAAWASWQRVLRLEPGDPAATEALGLLASADDLPAAARATYRFRPPSADRRGCWDAAFAGRDLAELDTAVGAFEELTADDPGDA